MKEMLCVVALFALAVGTLVWWGSAWEACNGVLVKDALGMPACVPRAK